MNYRSEHGSAGSQICLIIAVGLLCAAASGGDRFNRPGKGRPAGQAQKPGAAPASQPVPAESAKKLPEGEDPARVVLPEDLARLIGAQSQPLILHVGMPLLYRTSHIPGSKYSGQGSTPEGIKELKQTVAEVSKDREIVLYCGCCPWQNCPNIRPALKALVELGFTKVKELYIPNRFPQDWVDMGYPAVKGDRQ